MIAELCKAKPLAFIKALKMHGFAVRKFTPKAIEAVSEASPELDNELHQLAHENNISALALPVADSVDEVKQVVADNFSGTFKSNDKPTPRILGISKPIFIGLVAVVVIVAVVFLIKWQRKQ